MHEGTVLCAVEVREEQSGCSDGFRILSAPSRARARDQVWGVIWGSESPDPDPACGCGRMHFKACLSRWLQAAQPSLGSGQLGFPSMLNVSAIQGQHLRAAE